MELALRWIDEREPGPQWRGLFARTWDAYRSWFLLEGDAARPDLATCRAELARHMPELVPVWERLCDLAGADDQAARLLSLVNPSPYMAGCSQAVHVRERPVLVRNYDYHPERFEGVFLRSAWFGRTVVATSDSLWGVLDGMNADGLAVALSFGGRPAVGKGFGICLVLRYVLETCTTLAEACAVLKRVPSHMSYNVSVLDRSGAHAVVHVAPDLPTRIAKTAVATNDQGKVEWPRYDEVTRSRERLRFLKERLVDPDTTVDRLVDDFLQPPLLLRDHGRALTTLYTAVHDGTRGSILYAWPGVRREKALDGPWQEELTVRLS